MQLCEQYRPREWGDVIGQDKAARIVAALRPRGLAGRAYLIDGPTGTGKSTIGRLIAAEVAHPDFCQELDAGDLDAATLREWEYGSHYGAPEPGGRAYIVNECHGLKPTVVRQLLVTLERIPAHVAWVFTTTARPKREDQQLRLFVAQAEDAHPFTSRCVGLSTTSQGLAQAAPPRLLAIAREAGLVNGQPEAAMLKLLARLVHECHGNLREALIEIEKGALL